MNTIATIERAESLSELWTGTTTGKMIESQVERVKTSVMYGYDLAWKFVLDLSELCDNAEKELDDKI